MASASPALPASRSCAHVGEEASASPRAATPVTAFPLSALSSVQANPALDYKIIHLIRHAQGVLVGLSVHAPPRK